ncbi:asparagine synthase (glutamine-hydrolyzing) [Singulisphaera sp. GP187]|uniref:asparagine synthase (glutamine-hydrolyzing) n=1 Tax=Singulisphaera sp. GP187 TaxID=1882752 RepID=UPI0009F94BAC|nr:asparagine synthase (glutamine-hydrolyzing) [Singulisphaera sp. GP187]
MCGITGIVDIGGRSEADGAAIGRMTAALHHRGPDDSGSFIDSHAALGHARLSIIDLAAGHQPMCNEDESIWIVFNGEIYNFPELHETLEGRGHCFRSRCDTEAIIHLYEDYGDRCVDFLRGMFAFAIWDQKRRRLLLARDRLGIKPLYYWQDGTRLAFGSEIKAILQAPHVPRRINPEALQDFLTYHWVPAPKSMFEGIFKLPAGHTAILDEHGLRFRQYWDLHFPDPHRESEEVLRERFLAEFEESVRIHLLSDVPLGAFLSGGVDSSAVVATMAKLVQGPVVTNSIGFEESGFNELEYANAVAQKFGTDHHRQIVRPDVIDLVERLAWHYDEPFADSSAIPTYCVSRMTRGNVTVALSGDGGDENMAGYRKYKIHQRERALRRRIPSAIRRLAFGPMARLYPKADWLPRPLRAKSTFRNLASSDAEAIYLSRAAHAPELALALIRPEARARGYDPFTTIEDHYRRCDADDPLSKELYSDIKTYLCDDILVKVDRASMAVGLEVRVPILDHKFMEFMAAVPSDLKLRAGEGKYLFKQAVRPFLGPEVVDRPKMGFSVPLGEWFRGPLRELTEDTLFAPDAFIRSILDMDEIRRIWRAHQAGISSMESMIWAVFMLEQWGRNFLRADVSSPEPVSAPPYGDRAQSNGFDLQS